jgi:dolichol-phosphate mannosyltransferase
MDAGEPDNATHVVASDKRPFLSVVIPAHDEAGSIAGTIERITHAFEQASITDIEILVVNDHSGDRTEDVLIGLCAKHPVVRYLNNEGSAGYGHAVRCGLSAYRGDAVAIVMGDLSDSPADLLRYYEELKKGAECVFGSRFMRGSHVNDYPRHKLILNRLANRFIKILFRLQHNDITNAFKAYRREVIEGIQPLLSSHFNLTVEMPLKAIIRGYTHMTVPISWTNRKEGVSKLKIKEMGGRYLFIVLYCWLERKLASKDYHRRMSRKENE